MVFKEFKERLRSAGTVAANTLLHGPDQAEKIHQLTSMGFSPERARHALNATEGDVDRAAELLLLAAGEAEQQQQQQQQQQIPSHDQSSRTTQEGTHVAAHNDEQMRLAIEESLKDQMQARTNQKQSVAPSTMNEVIDLTGDNNNPVIVKKKSNNSSNAKKTSPLKQTSTTTTTATKTIKSAAAINAGKAATDRLLNHNNHTRTSTATNTATPPLNHTHPNIRLPEKMSNKSKEEQILRCAHRLKPHVMAVDTLLRALTSVRNMPDNPKFRVIDRTNSNYVAHVKDKPGAEDLLLAMNYRPVASNTNELRLERHLLDDALLYLGISALEQMRTSKEYVDAKKLRAFHAEMKRLAKPKTSMTESETAVRLAFMSKCPKEPPEGRGARLSVQLGDDDGDDESGKIIEGGKISRRFDGDDTLEDVLNWLGGCYGNELIDKIRGNNNGVREWCLCDLNVHPIYPLDVEKHAKKTLQYIGLFPSGKLMVKLSDDAWRDRKNDDISGGYDVHGSARGLGAASRSMLR